MICGKCGVDNENDAKFCSKCGNSIDEQIKCDSCGYLIKDTDAFCISCGKPIESKNKIMETANNKKLIPEIINNSDYESYKIFFKKSGIPEYSDILDSNYTKNGDVFNLKNNPDIDKIKIAMSYLENSKSVKSDIIYDAVRKDYHEKIKEKSKKDVIVILGTSASITSFFILPLYFGPIGIILGLTNLLRGFIKDGVLQIITSSIAFAYGYYAYQNILNQFLNFF